MQKNRSKLVMIHSVSIFILLLLWFLLIFLKGTIGKWENPLFILLIVLTFVVVVFLSLLMMREIAGPTKSDEAKKMKKVIEKEEVVESMVDEND